MLLSVTKSINAEPRRRVREMITVGNTDLSKMRCSRREFLAIAAAVPTIADQTVVTSSMHRGRIEFVQLESQAGAECRLRNPWGEHEVTLYRGGKKSENLQGTLLRFPTRQGERIVVVASGDTPSAHRKQVPA